MNRNTLVGLVTVNAALLIALGVLTFTPEPAQGQRLAAASYVMVGGQTRGRSSNTLYLADIANGLLVAVVFRGRRGNQLEVADIYNLGQDFRRGR